MFRPLTRLKQQIPEAECLEILKKEKRGILSVLGDDGYPYGMPMNHFYCEEDGKIYFHSARQGHKVDAIRRCSKVSYCVVGEGRAVPGKWALRFRSVIVFGKVELIEDRERMEKITAELSRKFTEDEEYIRREIERSGPVTLLFALIPEHITGKTVTES